MLSLFNLCIPARNQVLPLLFFVSIKTLTNEPISSFCVKRSKHGLSFCFQKNNSTTIMAHSKAKIVAEYAKSNRSTCKKCSTVISAKALRLGLVTKDSRGFDMTKWHHLDCFSITISSTDAIGGFASLQSRDQDALKKLISKGGREVVEGSPNRGSKRTRANMEEIELEERNSMITKLSTATEEAQLEIAVSQIDIKDTYKDVLLLPKWKAFQTVIFLEGDDGLHDSSKIAAFDFDGCLAQTSIKRIGADAWSLMYPSIPKKLQGLYKDGYKLVIFTNESNIDRWKNKRQVAVDSKIGRLNNFIRRVKVPIQVFIACADSKVEDPFRKPKPGMWQIMERHFNSGISIDLDQSFYVGDAAGRNNDHSDADIRFAQAVGLKFFVPEDYFGA
ncbi:polynucleotide 3'-phosphatase ZDP isoform X1 [Ricinus communis]|uniref:polynucleotide 3'-phosphatase ZDP isoform X1 n=1 Tax=Ricinus communis TaxID=3988 RepID=UPI00201AFB50|nr:polynucleotide 3'-phosphatase ZDP isoform X1 [Ricinus communis]